MSIQARLLVALAALSLAGCSIADLYAGRATVYNAESEQAHDQGILLNIIRAALRRPRQYTLVQQITGSATASSSVNFNIRSCLISTGTANSRTTFSSISSSRRSS